MTKEQAAYESIRDMIINNRLSPSQSVSIRKLCAVTGFGRTPVSEAIKRLTLEGWLSPSGNSTCVSAINYSERYEYMQVRGYLEILAAGLDAENITDKKILDFKHAMAVEELAIRKKDWIPAIEADIEFHKLCAKASENAFLNTYYTQLLFRDERIFFRNIDNETRRVESHVQHEAITQAIINGDRPSAEAAAAVHLDTILKRLKLDEY